MQQPSGSWLESATEISQQPSEYEGWMMEFFIQSMIVRETLSEKSLPSGFDETLPFNQSVVTTATVDQKTYLYFDIEMKKWRSVATGGNSEQS